MCAMHVQIRSFPLYTYRKAKRKNERERERERETERERQTEREREGESEPASHIMWVGAARYRRNSIIIQYTPVFAGQGIYKIRISRRHAGFGCCSHFVSQAFT